MNWPFGLLPGIVATVEQSEAGTGADKTLSIAPGAGEVWILMHAQGWHNDDGGNRTQAWSLDDSVTDMNVWSEVVAAGTISQLYVDCPAPVPLVLNEKFSVNFTISALGAGKNMYLRYCVYKLRGFEAWLNT